MIYCYKEEERDRALAELGDGATIQQYKGLGRWIPSNCGRPPWIPTAESLAQVLLDDAVAADEIFTILMGEKVEPRKQFIADNARDVVNLDVARGDFPIAPYIKIGKPGFGAPGGE